MQSDVVVKKAGEQDLEVLLSLGEQLFLVEKKLEPLMTFSLAAARKRYLSELNNPNAQLLLLYCEGDVAGYSYAHVEQVDYLDTDQPECELEVLYLQPSFRGKDLASVLLSEVMAWAKRKHAFRLRADILSGNESSINFFKKHGFLPNSARYVLSLDE